MIWLVLCPLRFVLIETILAHLESWIFFILWENVLRFNSTLKPTNNHRFITSQSTSMGLSNCSLDQHLKLKRQSAATKEALNYISKSLTNLALSKSNKTKWWKLIKKYYEHGNCPVQQPVVVGNPGFVSDVVKYAVVRQGTRPVYLEKEIYRQRRGRSDHQSELAVASHWISPLRRRKCLLEEW